jgi:Zn-dependent protease
VGTLARESLNLVKLFRIPIKIEPQFYVLSVFLALVGSRSLPLIIEWAVVVLVSVLVHELGHALTARAFGLEPQIRLYQMGGLTSWTTEKDLSPLKHLAVSLAGPAMGFVLGGLVLIVGKPSTIPSSVADVIYFDLLWINLGWSIFNLLPILPMDGGQVLVTLETWLRKRNDGYVSHVLSLLAALALAVAAFKWGSLWIGFLGIYFSYLNGSVLWKHFQSFRDRKLRKSLEEARAAIDRNELDAAMEILSHVTARASSSDVKQHALYMTIVVYVRQEKFSLATTELRRYTVLFGGDYYLEAALHFFQGEMAEALPNLKTLFENQPGEHIGIMLCKALIGIKDVPAALELCAHPALAEVRWGLTVEVQSGAFDHGDFKFCVAAGMAAWDQKADPKVAYNLACAFARDSNPSEALLWTEKAIDAGFDDEQALRADPDLEAIRSLPEFNTLLEKFRKRHP